MVKNVLDLFCGSQSITKAGKELGYNTFSTDIEFKSDYKIDILNFDYNKVPFIPDIIWASPPCTSFSVAGISHHWRKIGEQYKYISDKAELGIKLVLKTKEIISLYLCMNNSLIYYVENPRGLLRKLPIMDSFPIRHTVTYCQYGDSRMKATDIWTNNRKWHPRPMCKNGDKCHVSAPRGSRTGTQGLKNAYQKSIIPHELCLEVLTQI